MTERYDGDSEDSRAAFRDYDQRELARTKTTWQIWRDACAWQAARCNDTAPVAPIGDALRALLAHVESLYEMKGWDVDMANEIGQARRVLAAVAAQGE